MRPHHHLVTRLTIAALLVTTVTFGACAGHTRVYDPYYSDYHQWNSAEDGFYRRWEGETRRSHLDIGRRPAVEQHAYFDWRHKRR
jgi:hypothetical protein